MKNTEPLTTFTNRQQNEIEYHKKHAELNEDEILHQPFSYDVLFSKENRWWNGYWAMYVFLKRCDLVGKKVLIVGCGFGKDAVRIAKLGATMYAFDISEESLIIAEKLAKKENVTVEFRQMPAESLSYQDCFFDYIVAFDILHHVDIPKAIAEIVRVAKDDCILVVNEIYSHSITDWIRHSALVEKKLYPAMQAFVYNYKKPYITKDERKMTEKDIAEVRKAMKQILAKKYYRFLVTRIFPEKYTIINMLDKILLMILFPLNFLLAGRILLIGKIQKESGCKNTKHFS